MITKNEAARLIDISAVRTHHTVEDLKELAALAEQYHFINVHVLPNHIREMRQMISHLNDVYVGSPVGFPGGGHTTLTKLVEAQQMLQDGVQEMDIVMNVSRFLNGEYEYVSSELATILGIAKGLVKTKVIIEINCLNDTQMLKACELVAASGADFVKTGTGWVPGNANLDRIRLIKQEFGSDLKVKAAGGIRTLDDFLTLVDMGVERMGINTKSAIEIVNAL